MRNRALIALLVLGLVVGWLAPVRASHWQPWAGLPVVQVLANGRELPGDTPCVLIEGITYCPMRAIAAYIGGTLEWRPETHQVLFSYDPRFDQLAAEITGD